MTKYKDDRCECNDLLKYHQGVTTKAVRIWLPIITMIAIVIKRNCPTPIDYEAAAEKTIRGCVHNVNDFLPWLKQIEEKVLMIGSLHRDPFCPNKKIIQDQLIIWKTLWL